MTRWPRAIRTMHWAMAAFMLGVMITGFLMGELPGGVWQNRMYNLHRSFGITVLVLVIVRVGLRIWLPAPNEPSFASAFQAMAAKGTHKLLYVLSFGMPIFGWIGSSAFGAPVVLYGIVTLPALVEKNKALAEWTLELHSLAAWGMVILILAHFGGALYHQLLLKDGLIRRIWPI